MQRHGSVGCQWWRWIVAGEVAHYVIKGGPLCQLGGSEREMLFRSTVGRHDVIQN